MTKEERVLKYYGFCNSLKHVIRTGWKDWHVKEERLHILNEKINKYSKIHNEEYVGKIVPVLILGKSDKDKEKVYGYTDTMKLVNVVAKEDSIGKIVPVLITAAKSFSLDGKINE